MSALVHYGFNLHQKVSYFCRFFLQIPKKTVEHKHKDLLNSKHFGMYVYYHILYFMKYNCTLLVHVRITIMWAFFLDWYPNINLLFRKSIKPRFLHQKNGWITKKKPWALNSGWIFCCKVRWSKDSIENHWSIC